MGKLRLGIIGAGAISRAHLDAVAVREDAEVFCIADRDLERAEEKAGKYGIPHTVDDYNKLLSMDEIDGVVVGIPTSYHADAVLGALQRGKHVLCEKPMARTVAEGQEMLAAAQKRGLILQLAFVRRFDPGWLKLRELVQKEKVGRPCVWRRIVASSAPQPPSYGLWYTDTRYSDGPLMESGSHDLDFVCYTFGEVAAVTASFKRVGKLGDIKDTVNLILDYASGDQLLFSWSWALPQGASGFGGLDVIGPEGVIKGPEQIAGQDYKVRILREEGKEEEHELVIDRSREWYTAQMANFIESISGESTPRADGEDGLRVQRILEAARESASSGKRVEF